MLENRAAVQRANRLAWIYLIALAIVFGALAAYSRTAPGGASPGANGGLELFAAVALVLGAAGAALTLASAPLRIEVDGGRTVFVGRLGRRLTLPPLAELRLRVVRRFPAGPLAAKPLEQVELTPRQKGRARTFLLEERLLEESGAAAA